MPNTYLLAADNDPTLLPLLRETPSLASGQDEHGYSLVHAAASYNHLDLLRALITELNVPVDLRDEDGETALFVVETVDAARLLVEELHIGASIRNEDGQTAQEKIEAEGDFPAVSEYLKQHTGVSNGVNGTNSASGETAGPIELPPVPEGLNVTVGTMTEADETGQGPDPELRRRIEQLAARADFETPERQAELRQLIQDAVSGQGLSEERNVRPRQH